MIGNEKTKVVTSQKSFSSSASQTLFSAEPVTEKICLRSQATQTLVTWQVMMNFSFQGFLLYNYYKINKIKICYS